MAKDLPRTNKHAQHHRREREHGQGAARRRRQRCGGRAQHVRGPVDERDGGDHGHDDHVGDLRGLEGLGHRRGGVGRERRARLGSADVMGDQNWVVMVELMMVVTGSAW